MCFEILEMEIEIKEDREISRRIKIRDGAVMDLKSSWKQIHYKEGCY